MTARKPTTPRRTAKKPAKTIDLKAEDVTERQETAGAQKAASDVGETKTGDSAAPSEAAPKEAAAKEPTGKAESEKGSKPSSTSEAPTAKNKENQSGASEPVKPEQGAKTDGKNDQEPEAPVEPLSEASTPDDKDVKGAVAPSAAAPQGKGGFGSGLLGGLLGGVAIVALSYVGLQQGMIQLPASNADNPELTALSSDVSSLKDQISEIPTVDVAPLQVRIDEIEGQLAAATQALNALSTQDASPTPAVEPTASEGSVTEAPVVDSSSPVGLQLEALTARLEGLKERVSGIEGLNEQFLGAQAKIAQLEAQAAEQAKMVAQKAAEQTAKLEADLKVAKDEILSSADRRINDVVTDVSNLGDRLGQEATDLLGRVTSLEENNLSEKMQNSARMIALAGLENAMASGANYELALTTFTDVVGKNEALDILAQYAETGAPTNEVLTASFDAVYKNVLREAEDAGAATLLDKFLLNAQNLVKVRSISGEKKGESLTNRLGVIEFHLNEGNLPKAAEEWDALPEAARDAKAGADWLKGLKARIAVDGAMDKIRADYGNGSVAQAN